MSLDTPTTQTGVIMTTDRRKQSIHFPQQMLAEIHEEALRLDRSLSWIIQRAWKIARTSIGETPGSSKEPAAQE